jgi:hypothetical protein
MSAEINRNEQRVNDSSQIVFLAGRRNPSVAAAYSYLRDSTSARYADRDAAEMYRRSQLVPGTPEHKAQQERDEMMAWFAKYGCD